MGTSVAAARGPWHVLLIPIGFLALFYMADTASACNEAVCASLVSKCMLLKSCECDMRTNCSCCKDCYKCLEELYTECCMCVGMCPEQSIEDQRLSQKSSVEELKDPIPDLFNVLTEEPDYMLRWSTYSFPAHQDIKFFKPTTDHQFEFSVTDVDGSVKSLELSQQLNFTCTVAYMSQCMSLTKCKVSCSSMGASKYRWFHDGCCECVGHTCFNYGLNESKCLLCSEDMEEDDNNSSTFNESYDYDEQKKKKKSHEKKKTEKANQSTNDGNTETSASEETKTLQSSEKTAHLEAEQELQKTIESYDKSLDEEMTKGNVDFSADTKSETKKESLSETTGDATSKPQT